MTERQRKYAELRQNLDRLKRENHKLVMEEDKKNNEPASVEKKKIREEYEAEMEKRKQQLV